MPEAGIAPVHENRCKSVARDLAVSPQVLN